ncbi:unnamed protein product [Gordionus sp. m RMFG-2023]|uniref:uncharacterized protein LOC135930884 n=1 Tax=Gordionus sp. m RMFG-2023 TaxID=3053472 RepID=UPI0030E4C924
MRSQRDRELRELRNQGKVMECVGQHPASHFFLTSGQYTSFREWRFIHRARLNELPLNARPGCSRDPRCRRCGQSNETLPHVLNHCMRYSRWMVERHDAVVERLKTTVAAEFSILAENQVVDDTLLRPDLVIAKGNQAFIDVTIPFDNRLASLDAAYNEKIAKYQGIVQFLKQTYSSVDVVPIVVGSLVRKK